MKNDVLDKYRVSEIKIRKAENGYRVILNFELLSSSQYDYIFETLEGMEEFLNKRIESWENES